MNLFNDDCLKIMREMGGDCIDLVLTSPPYDNLRNYNGFAWNFEEIAIELSRILKPGGVIVWVVGDQTKNGCESLTSFKQAIFFVERAGLNLYDTMIYQRHGLPLSHRRYEQDFEYMFIFSKGIPKTFNPLKDPCRYSEITKSIGHGSASVGEKNSKNGGKQHKSFAIKENKIRGNVWTYPVGWMQSSCDDIAFQHPAIFPEKLAADHILSWSNEGDTVLDPFAGSGTTLKVAELLKRQTIGIEISREYCDIIQRRLNTEQMGLSL